MSSTRCSACGGDVAAESRFCPTCGANLAASAVVTAPPAAADPAPVARGFRLQAEGTPQDGRFPVGIILGERYRILGLLGRGGMGEVYRAHDLKLEQQVALKFLPETAAFNPSLMERFRGEVRIARQISHRNVCRVYDLGDVNGAAFISMEYVDGEDLSSLLRRIGRLPGDKALEFARRLCAGLAAAHEKGVLHRDLKPANIMIDGRGQLLIMDFGLAAVADAITGHDIRSGTPAYMSPEQKDGRDVTVRSDIYALGLVLAEMFSGSRPTADGTLSTTTKDVDPAVEKIIQRCVDANPAKRFASALDVARALPGGDPLAEALAAGETPSPQTVAASEDTGALSVRAAVLCLVIIAAALIGIVVVGERQNPLGRTPFRQSPEVLAAKARELAERLGYTNVADSAHGLFLVPGLEEYARTKLPPEQYDGFVRNARTAARLFAYRQSPRGLDTLDPLAGVSRYDPPPAVSDMVEVIFDPEGRLVSFSAVPPQEIAASPRMVDWKPLFEAAQLDLSQWTPTAATWIPLAGFDEQAAWIGAFAHAPSIPIHIDAAAWKGRVVQFEVRGPWSQPARDIPQPQLPPFVYVQIGLLWTVIFLGGLLAAQHYRQGRGDLAGAARLAAFSFTCGFIAWLLSSHHGGVFREFVRALGGAGSALATAAMFGVLYIAFEPIVRRRWPQSLISWTRLLNGAVADPVVGGHVLVGLALGLTTGLLFWGLGQDAQVGTGVPLALDARRAVALMIGAAGGFSTGVALALFFFFFLLRTLLRRTWAGAAAVIGPLVLVGWLVNGLTGVGIGLFIGVSNVAILTNYGLLAIAAAVFAGTTIQAAPLTTDLSVWYSSAMLTVLAVFVALTLWCFRAALGGRRLLKADLLDA